MTKSIALTVVLALLAAPAWADRVPPVTDPLVEKECGSCHMAFQPAFLPARSWSAILGRLDDHFGENASLDAASSVAILAYLTSNAADRAPRRREHGALRGIPPAATPLRITETPWWVAEHRGEVSPGAWSDPRVRSKANCIACHAGAERGLYDD